MKKVAMLLATVGILVAVYAVVGRFVYDRTVLGCLIQNGMASSSLMIGANTILLLAMLAAFLGNKKQA